MEENEEEVKSLCEECAAKIQQNNHDLCPKCKIVYPDCCWKEVQAEEKLCPECSSEKKEC